MYASLPSRRVEPQDRQTYYLLAKFTQHDHLKKHLIDTNDKTLAEANGRDSYFAIGLPLTHPDVLDSTKWADNSNRLGNILMEIRQEQRSELS